MIGAPAAYGAHYVLQGGRWKSLTTAVPSHVPNPEPGQTTTLWDEHARTFGTPPLFRLPTIPTFLEDGAAPPAGSTVIDAATIEAPTDTLQQVVDKAKAQATDTAKMYVLHLTARVYEVRDFAQPSYEQHVGVWMPKNISLHGQGMGNTVIRMVPNTSHFNASDAFWGGVGGSSPKCGVIRVDGPLDGWAIRNLSVECGIQGSDNNGRGHPYNGIQIDNAKAPVVENVKVRGWRGYLPYPPGETGGITTSGTKDMVLRNVELDGRELGVDTDAVSARVGTAGVMLNDHVGGALIDVTVHHTWCGGGALASWKTYGVSTFNYWGHHLGGGTNPSDGKILGTHGLNHERVDRLTHYSPRFQMDRTASNPFLQFSLNNDQLVSWDGETPVVSSDTGKPGTFLLVDPAVDTSGLGDVNGHPSVSTWWPYDPLTEGAGHVQRNGPSAPAGALDRRGRTVTLSTAASDGTWPTTNLGRPA